jgi:integrase
MEVSDIDSQRMVVHVHHGKGTRDCLVPLPQSSLLRHGKHWATHRRPALILPALGRGRKRTAVADSPMPKTSVQGAFRQAKGGAGIPETAHFGAYPAPFLRHPSVRGRVNLRIVQQWLRHAPLDTTGGLCPSDPRRPVGCLNPYQHAYCSSRDLDLDQTRPLIRCAPARRGSSKPRAMSRC